MARRTVTDDQVKAFKDEIVAVCQKYGLYFDYYYIHYDEYEHKSGLEICPLKHAYDLSGIGAARLNQ